MNKEPLSKGHLKGTIGIKETQSGWTRNWAAILKEGKADL
jgi:hypothetical protein